MTDKATASQHPACEHISPLHHVGVMLICYRVDYGGTEVVGTRLEYMWYVESVFGMQMIETDCEHSRVG
jgi:hypothetical protein